MSYKAKAKYIRVSPLKARKLADLIRNKDVLFSLNFLKNQTQKSASILYKLVYSCLSNSVNNFKADPSSLYISELLVNEGPKFKRMSPRARGRSFRILKPTSHFSITLNEKKGKNNGTKD